MADLEIHASHEPEPDGVRLYPGGQACRRCCRFVAFEGSTYRVTEAGAQRCQPAPRNLLKKDPEANMNKATLNALRRIATSDGVTLDDVRSSFCDLEGYTPTAEATTSALRELVRRGQVSQGGNLYFDAERYAQPLSPGGGYAAAKDQVNYHVTILRAERDQPWEPGPDDTAADAPQPKSDEELWKAINASLGRTMGPATMSGVLAAALIQLMDKAGPDPETRRVFDSTCYGELVATHDTPEEAQTWVATHLRTCRHGAVTGRRIEWHYVAAAAQFKWSAAAGGEWIDHDVTARTAEIGG